MDRTKLALAGATLLALGVLATRIDTSDPEVKAELEAAALEDKSTVALTVTACPECEVQVECCRLPDEPQYQCMHGLKYGPGLGGIDADGKPVTCTCPDKSVDDGRWVRDCVGTSADHEAQVETMRTTLSKDEVLEVLARKIAEREATKPQEQAPAVPEKER